MMRTAPRGQSRVCATKSINASFAAESTGGAVTLTFNSLPKISPMAFFEALGWTLRQMTTPSGLICKNGGMQLFGFVQGIINTGYLCSYSGIVFSEKWAKNGV